MTLFYGGDQRYRIRLADSNIAGDKARRELLKIRRPGLQQMHFGGVNCQFRDLLILRENHYKLAHYRVETDSHKPEDVAKSILLLREAYE